MSEQRTHFTRTARWLHWSMAVMILAMLFIGVAMVTSLELRPWLIDMHRPLGLLILLLALVRVRHRRRNPPSCRSSHCSIAVTPPSPGPAMCVTSSRGIGSAAQPRRPKPTPCSMNSAICSTWR